MISGVIERPAGIPSKMAVRDGPWDSPAVRKRKGNVYRDPFVADQLRRGTPTQVKVYRRLHA